MLRVHARHTHMASGIVRCPHLARDVVRFGGFPPQSHELRLVRLDDFLRHPVDGFFVLVLPGGTQQRNKHRKPAAGQRRDTG